MTRATLLLTLFVVGCLQPVDVETPIITSCRGSCPFGACDEACGRAPDAGCSDPADCLAQYACQREMIPSTCAAYGPERFTVRGMPTACSPSGDRYCVSATNDAGARVSFAVLCGDAGAAATECVPRACTDGGSPESACARACGASYCLK